ncbi:MAG: archaemetzincin family Zn-dependent metalloprotease [Candidatus Hermodarchaeota archaeon]
MKRVIYLQKIGEIDPVILIKLKKNLKWNFKGFSINVKISKDYLPLEESDYDRIRKQYDASAILKKLVKHISHKQYFRTLGIVDEDIYSRFLNFVFGIAIIPKPEFRKFSGIALISITRLREIFYRRKDNDPLFELRVLKEAIHELGHTFGLKHCDNRCVMKFSNHLADTDNKPPKYCEGCYLKLNKLFDSINKHD